MLMMINAFLFSREFLFDDIHVRYTHTHTYIYIIIITFFFLEHVNRLHVIIIYVHETCVDD